MSDDLNDEQLVLASAYLDGAVTSAERAQVDADPQLLGEVERLRAVRVSLTATTTTAISTRERHLAGALGAWDRLSDAERTGSNAGGLPAFSDDPAAAAAATVTAPTPLADRRKRVNDKNSGRLLTAAAVVLVIAGGGLIARGIIDSDSNDSSVASESAELPAQRAELSGAAADEAFATEEPDDIAADIAAELARRAETAIGSTTGRLDDLVVIDSPETLAEFANQQLAFEADIAQSSELPVDAAEPAAEAPAEESLEEPAEADTAQSDAAAGSLVTDLTESDDLTCGLVDRIIADAEYGSDLYPTPVAIGVDAGETEAIAFRVSTCEVVARASLSG